MIRELTRLLEKQRELTLISTPGPLMAGQLFAENPSGTDGESD